MQGGLGTGRVGSFLALSGGLLTPDRKSEGPRSSLVSPSWAGLALAVLSPKGALSGPFRCPSGFLSVNPERLASVSYSQPGFESKCGSKYSQAFESCW